LVAELHKSFQTLEESGICVTVPETLDDASCFVGSKRRLCHPLQFGFFRLRRSFQRQFHIARDLHHFFAPRRVLFAKGYGRVWGKATLWRGVSALRFDWAGAANVISEGQLD
jgi:hypothetical protein